ncbi:unnamed protein product, partial [Auanema sp. JU1783]
MSLYAFLKNQESAIVADTLRYLYVDNIFYTTNDPAELVNIYKESKSIFSQVSMNIREYFSNHTDTNSTFSADDQHPDKNPKILGIKYHSTTDTFVMTCQLRSQHTFTKRDLLSSLHSVYDPLGLAAPFLLHFKLLLRQVMNGAIDWKEQVPVDIVNNWNTISTKIGAARIEIPRSIITDEGSNELWIFVDASILAKTACAFYTSSMTRTPLIMGKTKLASKHRALTI